MVLGLRGLHWLWGSEQVVCALRESFQFQWAPTYRVACPARSPQEPVIYLGKKPAVGFQLHTRGRACSITSRRDEPRPHSAAASERQG